MNSVTDLSAVRDLRVEVEGLEAAFGPNPYSTYLFKRGKRPDPKEAAAIGQMMGARVRASDGKMYPAISAAGRAAKVRREEYARRTQQLLDLQNAITLLAELKDGPELFVVGGSVALDAAGITARLPKALSALQRFSDYWNELISPAADAAKEAPRCPFTADLFEGPKP